MGYENNEIIEMHASWLTVNSVVGCTNGCKYCFLQSSNNNITKPVKKCSPYEAIQELKSSKYYSKDMPVCLLPNTDPFLTGENINYLVKLLKNIEKENIYNPIIIITKCYIPEYFIEYVKKLIKGNFNIIFYLSYSGLDKKIEPNVNHEAIRKNFINLHNACFKVLHYYRPFLPQNSSSNAIDKVLDFVNKYSCASVITGLKVRNDFIENIDFWDAIKTQTNSCLNAEGVWPKTAYDYFYNKYKNKQNIYQTNSCALSLVLEQPNLLYYDSYECRNYNHCPKKQRMKCKNAAQKKIVMSHKELLKQLKKIDKNIEEKNIIISNKDNVTLNYDLPIGDILYLNQILNKKVICSRCDSSKYWNTAINGSKPFIIDNEGI